MSQTELPPSGSSSSSSSSSSGSSPAAPAPAAAAAVAASSSSSSSSSRPSGPQRRFQEAVRSGNTAAVQSVLQGLSSCEFNVNSFGPEGQTALHQSVIEGNLELVKLLVKFGADVRLANRDGWSALHIAAFGGHQDIVLYLVTKAKYAHGSPPAPAPALAPALAGGEGGGGGGGGGGGAPR